MTASRESQTTRRSRASFQASWLQLRAGASPPANLTATPSPSAAPAGLKAKIFALLNVTSLTDTLKRAKDGSAALSPQEKYAVWEQLKILSAAAPPPPPRRAVPGHPPSPPPPAPTPGPQTSSLPAPAQASPAPSPPPGPSASSTSSSASSSTSSAATSTSAPPSRPGSPKSAAGSSPRPPRRALPPPAAALHRTPSLRRRRSRPLEPALAPHALPACVPQPPSVPNPHAPRPTRAPQHAYLSLSNFFPQRGVELLAERAEAACRTVLET